MIALLLAAFLGVPPYPQPPKVSPPAPKAEARERRTCTDGSVIERTGTGWTLVSGAVLQNVGASAQVPTNGCYLNAAGQKVCPAKR